MKKRFLSILLTMCMVLGLMPVMAQPVTVQAATGSPVQTVKIGTVTLDATNKYYHNGANGAQGTADDSSDGANATFDAGTGTLTLNGLNITTTGPAISWEYDDYGAGAHDLTIALNGTNTISSSDKSGIAGERGFDDGPSLTITGSGSLNVRGNTCGIWVWNNITICDEAEVNATGTDKYGICNNNSLGTITFEDSAVVTATGGQYGIGYDNADTNFNVPVIKGDTVTLTGGTAAVRVKADYTENSPDLSGYTSGCKVTVGDTAESSTTWDSNTLLKNYKYIKIEKDAQTPSTTNLSAIRKPQNITGVENGTAKTAAALGLPTFVTIETEDSKSSMATVTWDLENLASGSYDPSVRTAQTFTVNGTVTLPDGITNTNSISLTVVIQVSVSAASSSGSSISSGGTTSEVTTSKDSESNTAITTSPTEVKVESGTASATVKAENVTEAIKQASDNKSAELVFTVSDAKIGNADTIRMTISKTDVQQVLDKTEADLVVDTPAGDVILSQDTMGEVLQAAAGTDLTIEVTKVTNPTEVQKQAAGDNGYIVGVTIVSQNKAITTFGGKTLTIRLEIPTALLDKEVAAIHIADDGTTEKMLGKVVIEGTKQYYEFTTTHLSTFALIEETPTAIAPKKGTLLTDRESKMVYKVTKSGTTGGTVQFIKTKNTKTKTIAIPDKVTIDGITYKVTSVAANALKNNKVVTTVTIGKYVTSIGSGAFSGCTKLKKVTIGKGVTTIGSKAFYKCTSLTSITIPSKVKKIGDYAFKGCSKLKTINLNTTLLTTKTVSEYAFSDVSASAVVKVPKSKLKTYKTLFVKKGLSKKITIKKL